MSNIVSMRKREPTKKEAALSEFVESVENLQVYLVSVGKQGELWSVFDNLRVYVGECMKESIAGKGNK